jgi:hypothetical protein
MLGCQEEKIQTSSNILSIIDLVESGRNRASGQLLSLWWNID